jgi:hypothetical protein
MSAIFFCKNCTRCTLRKRTRRTSRQKDPLAFCAKQLRLGGCTHWVHFFQQKCTSVRRRIKEDNLKISLQEELGSSLQQLGPWSSIMKCSGACRWGTLWAPHRPYYREVGRGYKAPNQKAKKITEQSNVQDKNSNSDYTRKGARSIA